MRSTIAFFGFILIATVAQAQTFSSGSTGGDGPYSVSCGGGAASLQVPPSGVFNFTTVTIQNCFLSFIPNQRNTPVIILAQGNVVITSSNVLVDASDQTPGSGGFFGGALNQAGFGPGGGAPGQHGQWVGPLSLVPPIGGSGGGGHPTGYGSSFGGGGGGAIVIASSTSIQCSGGIFARGGVGWGGGGAGGAIRLVANAVSGGCTLNATPGSSNSVGTSGNNGLIRIEAQSGQLLYTGSSTPSAVLSTINAAIIPTSTTASLTVASIGGFPVSSDAGVRPGTVDVVLPRALSDPISVAVQARNIPVGTQVNMNLSGSSGVTYTSGTLAGSLDLSTATLLVSGLSRSAETHLFVFATFDVPQSAALFNPAGPDYVARVRVQAAPGKPSTMAFLRKDGSEIDPKKIPPRLLSYLNHPTR